MRMASLVILAGTARVAAAQSGPAAVFEAGIEPHIAEVRRQFESAQGIVQRGSRTTPNVQAGARQQALDEENASTLPKLASLAFRTDVKDANAGVVVAPLVLLGNGSEFARSFGMTVAAVEEDRFRAGISMAIPLRDSTLELEDLGLEVCKFDETDSRKKLAERKVDYVAVCGAIPAIPYPNSSKDMNLNWLRGVIACGGSIPADVAATWDPLKLDDLVKANRDANLISHVDAVVVLANTASSQPPEIANRFSALEFPLKRLADMRQEMTQTSCLKEDQITKAAVQAKWTMPTLTLGFSARADFYPLKFGFDPKDEFGPNRLAEHEERVELRYSAGRLSLSGGVGVKGRRDDNPDPVVTSLRPAIGVQWVVGRLDGKVLYDDKGRIAVRESGALPPLFVLGLDAVFGFTVRNRPESQEGGIDELGITLYADFRVNEDVAFRLGVPLKAEIATREADMMMLPPVTEKKALQVTLPVFLGTVLEL